MPYYELDLLTVGNPRPVVGACFQVSTDSPRSALPSLSLRLSPVHDCGALDVVSLGPNLRMNFICSMVYFLEPYTNPCKRRSNIPIMVPGPGLR